MLLVVGCPGCAAPPPPQPPSVSPATLPCSRAGPQSPANVTLGARGRVTPREAPLDSVEGLVLVNVHFQCAANRRLSRSHVHVRVPCRVPEPEQQRGSTNHGTHGEAQTTTDDRARDDHGDDGRRQVGLTCRARWTRGLAESAKGEVPGKSRTPPHDRTASGWSWCGGGRQNTVRPVKDPRGVVPLQQQNKKLERINKSDEK